jgi:hypothetical protein
MPARNKSGGKKVGRQKRQPELLRGFGLSTLRFNLAARQAQLEKSLAYFQSLIY